jgi:hypothetical protein
MTNLSSSASSHLNWLNALQAQLSGLGVAVLEHNYLLLLMGSFSLVVGTAHRRLRFDWDGREFFLNIQQCCCENQSTAQAWNHLKNSRISPPDSVEVFIERECSEVFHT